MAAAVSGVSVNMSGHLQNQLTRSLERILEDAYLSGELKLSGRKLKDFPKTGKYDLTDTVIADLSKNRFGDLPDELTSYLYLERLLLGHNAIRHVPDTVGSLQSLTYLDLSFNHLTELAREICLLPLEVLIVANNQLTSLPKEMGKMVSLAELDAGCNRIAHLPIAIGDLSNMRALNLRNNQLTLLPLQITYLRLEMLDVSCNCISSLPLELRMMTSLVILKLDHNPLVSPPTIVCMRGRVHIFRYLESMANRDSVTHRRHDDIRRSGKHSGPYGGYATPSPGAALTDPIRARTRHTVDSGYNTCDGEKRWSNDGGAEDACLMYPSGVTFGGNGISGGSGRSTPSTPSTLSPGSANLSRAQSLNSDGRNTPQNGHRISPDSNMLNGDDKTKTLNHQQTYRQYKEALRQQRQQDIYRPREQASPSDADILHSHHSPIHLPKHSQSTPHSPIANGHYVSALPSLSYTRNVSSNPSLSTATGFQAAISPLINGSPPVQSTPKRSQSPSVNGNSDEVQIRRPVQKVVPSRNVSAPNKSNGNVSNGGLRSTSSPIDLQKDGSYVKPLSPTKSPTSILHHGGISPSDGRYTNANGSEPAPKLLTTTVGYLKGANAKPPGSSSRLTWNKDVPPDKLSFTMKREFDKAKEESDLIHQLRSIIETRLKMTLPEDIAPVLTDGVVLCHLANHVRPRAVASVHVPSPAQPKLTMARCRRNVDNFLEACRKIGVEEAAVCRPEDVLLCADGSETERRQLLVAVARTAHALHRLATRAAVQLDPFCDEQDEEYRDRSFTEYEHAEAFYRDDRSAIEIARTADGRDDSRFVDDVDSVYNSSDSYRETSILQPKVSFRNRYDEERSVSNFNCFAAEGPKELDFQNFNDPTCNVTACDNSGSENSKITTGKVNKVTPIINVRRSGKLNGVGERIHQFNNYNRTGMKLRFQDNLNESLRRETIAEDEKNRTLVTALCLGSFFLSAILLYIFPLP